MQQVARISLGVLAIALVIGSVAIFTDFLIGNDTDTDLSGRYDDEEPTTTLTTYATSLPPGTTPATSQTTIFTPYLNFVVWGFAELKDACGEVVERRSVRMLIADGGGCGAHPENQIETYRFVLSTRIRSNNIRWNTLTIARWLDFNDFTSGKTQQVYWQKWEPTETIQFKQDPELWQDSYRELKGGLYWGLNQLRTQGIDFTSPREIRFTFYTQIYGTKITGEPFNIIVKVGFKTRIHLDVPTGQFIATDGVIAPIDYH